MSESNGTVEQVEAIRRQSIAVLDEMVGKAREYDLADLSVALDPYRKKLRDNTYNVLVVGEAKRGKSSFINALIGRDILPMDVDVATSQVFRIRSVKPEQVAYRVRFADDSAREITAEDLSRYGSQVEADAGLAPDLKDMIHWIEVDVPVRFLPPGVNILDTPGLGALYKEHARITHQFVPMADAAIFVLESGQPVIDDDLKFIDKILEVTRNIFFIQTKIDQFKPADKWQEILRRNAEILKGEFGERLADVQVWPVSNALLRKAATAETKKAEAYFIKSRHKQLEAALREFLARVAGLSRTAEALRAAAEYHQTPRKTLHGRLAAFGEESQKKRAEMQKNVQEKKLRFDAEWNANSQNQHRMRKDLKKALKDGRQDFQHSLQASGEIAQAQKAKIKAVKSLKEANQVAKEMPDEVVAAALAKWTEVGDHVHYRCVELLRPFSEAADELSAPLESGAPSLNISNDGSDEEFKVKTLALVRGAAAGTMPVGLAGSALYITAGTAMPPLGLLAVPVLVWLAKKGKDDVIEQTVKAARQELEKRLNGLLAQVNSHFFKPDLVARRSGVVDEYFDALERAIDDQVQETVAQKNREYQAEVARLTEAFQMGEGERGAKAQEVRRQLDEWDAFATTVGDLQEQIKAASERPRAAAIPR